jgi:hypothetical protein
VGAAEDPSISFDSVTDYAAAAVLADRCERVDRALEAVEHVCFAVPTYLERLVVVVAADLAGRHRPSSFVLRLNRFPLRVAANAERRRRVRGGPCGQSPPQRASYPLRWRFGQTHTVQLPCGRQRGGAQAYSLAAEGASTVHPPESARAWAPFVPIPSAVHSLRITIVGPARASDVQQKGRGDRPPCGQEALPPSGTGDRRGRVLPPPQPTLQNDHQDHKSPFGDERLTRAQPRSRSVVAAALSYSSWRRGQPSKSLPRPFGALSSSCQVAFSASVPRSYVEYVW